MSATPSTLELALRARIPVISITSDDPVYQGDILCQLSGMLPYEAIRNVKVHPERLYWTNDDHKDGSILTTQLYLDLEKNESVLVLVNPPKPNAMAFDAGPLMAPRGLLAEKLGLNDVSVLNALNGLSIKAAKETVALTAARTGEVSAEEIRRTRALTAQALVPGLSVVSTAYDFYEVPERLQQWMSLNLPHLNHPKLAPRGLLFTGPTGVGKSTAPKYIAKTLNLPLYRLDIAEALDKWTGVSEHRVSRALAIVEREAPAVLLIDEVEKIFGGHTEAVDRILSQLLWWLAEHRSRVLTLMTTNNFKALPQELYRPGRMDEVMVLDGLTHAQALEFAYSTYEAVTGEPVPAQEWMTDVIDDAFLVTKDPTIAHARIRQLVLDHIKKQGWKSPLLKTA